MATSSFYLKVISANRVFFAGKCRSLIVPEFDGQKEILAHHEDVVIAIDEGQMKLDDFLAAIKEEEAKQRAEERLRQKQSIHEYYHSRAALARAMARLKATSGK